MTQGGITIRKALQHLKKKNTMATIESGSNGKHTSPPSPPPEIRIVAPDIARLSFSNISFPANSKNWPAFHITSPWGWINDPCGPGYDPATKTYHLFYQWNSKGCGWGNISWGHLTSKDMLRWRRNGTKPVIQASKQTGKDHNYDKEAIFTGCMVPTGPRGEKNQLTAIYTSIAELPFHWSAPYPRGAAGLAAAVSDNGGQTWDKHPDNPFVVEEPPDVKVTGFRDPYVDSWPHLDEILGEVPGSSRYGVMSGGILGECATVFLYQISPQNLLDWKYIGCLIKAKIGFRPSRKWTGDSGVNWECANFMTLTSRTGVSRDMLLLGTEGGEDRDHVLPSAAHAGQTDDEIKEDKDSLPQRVPRWPIWMSAVPRKSSTPERGWIEMDYKFGGIYDHGSVYALNSFHDGLTGKRIAWSWLIEEDVPLEHCKDKGWTGCISLPRELFLFEIDHVVSGFKSSFDELAHTFEAQHSKHNRHTIRTLGIRPFEGLKELRLGAPSAHIDKMCKLALPLSEPDKEDLLTSTDILAPGTRWELDAVIRVHDRCEKVGFKILHGSKATRPTEIVFDPQNEEIIVRRPKPKENPWPVNDREERGAHTLFRYSNGNTEKLNLRIFRDGQVLEVFANDRWALGTMIYAGDEDDEGTDKLVTAFATTLEGTDPGEPGAVFEDIKVFEMASGIVSTHD